LPICGVELAAQPAPTGNFPVSSVTNGDAPGEAVLGNAKLTAISYGAFRTTTRTEANVPSVTDLKEDLKIMHASGIRMLRTYNTQGFSDTENLLIAISQLKEEDASFEMNVMLGVWISALNAFSDQPIDHSQESPENDAEMDKAVEFAQNYPDIIKVIAVGNEAMVEWASSYRVEPGIILSRVNELQALKADGTISNNIWITSSENWAVWAINNDYYRGHEADIKALIQAVDYVSVHVYPFHDTQFDPEFWRVPADEQSMSRQAQADAAMGRAFGMAMTQFDDAQTSVLSVDSTKQVHIGETGWSTLSSEGYGAGGTGAADEYKQKAYFDAMSDWAGEYGASVFFFQAFDEPWKGDSSNPSHSEQHFGLVDINGNAKYAIWDQVDAGAFDGITRGGNPIVKSNGGNAQTVIDGILAIPYAFNAGGVIEGNEYTIYNGAVNANLTAVAWENTAWLAANPDKQVLELTTPPTAGTAKDWGWGASAAVSGSSGQNLTGFENGYLMFDIKGTTTTAINIGFQTGAFGDSTRPQTNNGVAFGPGGYSITSEWQSYKIPVTELTSATSPDFTDVTSPIFFQGSTDDGGVLELRNVRFSKTGETDGGTDGGGTGSSGTGYILYTGQESTITFEDLQAWNGAGIESVTGGTYDPALTLTVTDGWGALAWVNTSTTVDITPYTHAEFKVLTDADQVRVSISSQSEGESANDYSLSTGTDLTGGWVQMSVPLPAYTDMTTFAVVLGQNGTLQIADVAFVNNDTDGGTEAPETAYILYTGQESNFAFEDLQAWNGTSIEDVTGGTYDPALDVTATNGWGALAWVSPINPVDVTPYTHAQFKVKTDLDAVRVAISSLTQDEDANDYMLSTGTALDGGWVQMEVPLPDFDDMTIFAIVLGQNGTLQIADVAFVNNDTDGGTNGGTTTVGDGIDFETNTLAWEVFENDDNPAIEFVSNPDASGTNNSNTVAKIIARTAGAPWAGAITRDVESFTLDASNSVVRMMVYKDKASTVRFKLETASGYAQELLAQNTAVNQWEELTFDFSDVASLFDGPVTGVVIFPDFVDADTTRSADTTMYFDNVTFNAEGTDGGTDG
ncbi:hypothetical protein A1OQ_20760, partial [Enterovibrio norvegicus FF-162]|uniref:hypothetical protein n=1 Tax=Enterovibrio norvegicus TaxID=188144 RepID=UPI000686FC8F